MFWPYVFETDQADTGDRFAVMELWAERVWQKSLDPVRIGPKVYQYATLNYSL